MTFVVQNESPSLEGVLRQAYSNNTMELPHGLPSNTFPQVTTALEFVRTTNRWGETPETLTIGSIEFRRRQIIEIFFDLAKPQPLDEVIRQAVAAWVAA